MDDQKIPSSLVTFEDDISAVYTDRSLSYCQTEESKDPSAYSELIEFHIVQDLISVLEIHDLDYFRLDMVTRKLTQSMKNKEMQAYATAFGFPGTEPAEIRASRIRLSDFRRVLGE